MKEYSIYYYDHNDLRKFLGTINVSNLMSKEEIIQYLINDQGYPGTIFLIETNEHC